MNRHDFLQRLAVVLGLLGLVLSCAIPAHTADLQEAPHYLNVALIDGKKVQRWNDDNQEVVVYLEPGTGVAGWNPQKAQVVKEAFLAWQNALEGRLRFRFTSNPDELDITVHWSNQAKGDKVGNQNMTWRHDILTHARIEISMVNPQGRPFTDLETQYIALHEVGHVLGIRGHSDQPGDVMFLSLQGRTAALSARDIATIRALYALKPDITNPVGISLSQYQKFNQMLLLGTKANQELKYETAYKQFIKAQRFYPRSRRIAYYVGISAYNVHDYEMAVPHLERAVEYRDENYLNAEFCLAKALVALGSDEILMGKREQGLARLLKAKDHFNIVLNHPDATAQMREVSRTNLAELVSVLPSRSY